MRLLVVGASGQVGGYVVDRALALGHEVVGGFCSRPPERPEVHAVKLDKRERVGLAGLIARIGPEAVIDTGALHNVDYCETHPEEAMAVNRDGTRALSAACERIGALYLFVSTDFVFDGSGHPPYLEEADPSPPSVYGASKLAGERAALAASPRAIVVRPSVVYSWVPHRRRADSVSGKTVNFASWLADELSAGRTVRIVKDQIASPTLADDLAGALLALVTSPARGLFHAAGATALSRYDFALALARRLSIEPSRVEPIDSATLAQKARRPSNSSLSSERLARETGYRMLTAEAGLERFGADFAREHP